VSRACQYDTASNELLVREVLDGAQPNALRISRAAPIDRNSIIPEIDAKIGLILGPRSGVGLHALVGPHSPLHLIQINSF